MGASLLSFIASKTQAVTPVPVPIVERSTGSLERSPIMQTEASEAPYIFRIYTRLRQISRLSCWTGSPARTRVLTCGISSGDIDRRNEGVRQAQFALRSRIAPVERPSLSSLDSIQTHPPTTRGVNSSKVLTMKVHATNWKVRVLRLMLSLEACSSALEHMA